MSIGPVLGYTTNYRFTLVNYDYPRWHSYENNNWTLLDGVVGALFGGSGISGIWSNSTSYNVNQRIIDSVSSVVYICAVANTSAATGTFAQDRTAHPTYWTAVNQIPQGRGVWVGPGTNYAVSDIVTSGNKVAACRMAHISSSSFNNDVTAGDWTIILDLTGYNPTLCLTKANNLSDVASVPTARTNLGLGSAALVDASTLVATANNLSDVNAASARTNLGLGTAALHPSTDYLLSNNSLSDLINVPSARTNLGLGPLALKTQVDPTTDILNAGATGITVLQATTTAVATAIFDAVVGDTGMGGKKGLAPAPGSGDGAANKYLDAKGGWSVPQAASSGIYAGIRQTVTSGPTVSSAPAFLNSSSASLTIGMQGVTSVTPLTYCAAAGFGSSGAVNYVGQLTTNGTWTGLVASATNYLFINAQTGALTSSTLAPIYQFGGTVSTNSGQFSFDYQAMIGYLGNGTTAVPTPMIAIGEAVTNSTAVTSTVAYAYNGYYDSGFTNGLPALSTAIVKQSNLGITPNVSVFLIENITIELGYLIGDRTQNVAFNSSGVINPTITLNKNTITVTGPGSSYALGSKTTGIDNTLTLANWKWKLLTCVPWRTL